ncbi:Ig-like domain-containing protein [Patescibacteria group bacterium]
MSKRRKSNKTNVLVIIAALTAAVSVGGFFSLVSVSAQTSFSIEDIGSSIGLGSADLKDVVINVIKWALGILALAAVAIMIYGGFLWITARGREEQIEKAKKVIIGALIGVVIVLLSWAIVLFVERFISGSTQTGGTVCTPGDQIPPIPATACFVCNATGTSWVPTGDPACIPGPSVFTLTDVETSNNGDATDVHLCSNANSIFNHRLNAQTILDADTLGDLGIYENPNTPGEIEVLGSFIPLTNSATWKHQLHCSNDRTQSCNNDADCGGAPNTCDKLFAANTDYEARFPQSIENFSGDFLQACSALPGCSFNNITNNFEFDFHVGVTTDIVEPTIVSADPMLPGNPGYPDRTISRYPIIDVSFNEPIDMTTVAALDVMGVARPIPANVKIEQWDNDPDAGGAYVVDVDPNIIQVQAKPQGFKLSLDGGHLLEPFTWYKIIVDNVEDLCGNSMVAQVDWNFQTTDAVPGVVGVYPPAGSSNVCPDTKIVVTFGTTMFNSDVTFQVTGGSVPIVITLPAASTMFPGPYTWTDGGGNTIRVVDPGPTADNNFRVYEVTPGVPLDINTTYDVAITTTLQIDVNGTTLSHNWQFATSTPELCACTPFVATVQPNQGPRGMCVSIVGECFDGTAAHPATVSNVEFDVDYGNPPPPAPWTSGEVTYNILLPDIIGTSIPLINTNDGNNPIFFNGDWPRARVTIAYADPAYGSHSSDPATNSFFVNSDNLADGPCLFSLNPGAGIAGTTVNAKGIRFGDPPPAQTTAEIHFEDGSGGANAGWLPGGWSQTDILTSVPGWAIDGDVFVRNDAGDSNKIYFDVIPPAPTSPMVLGHWPICASACLNAGMGADFNLNVEMDPTTIDGNTINVWKCTDGPTCNVFDPIPVAITVPSYVFNPIIPMNRAEWFGQNDFDPIEYYRVIMSNGILALSDGTPITNLNYDDPNNAINGLDSFSWIFQTGASACDIDTINTLPDAVTMTFANQQVGFVSTPYGPSDACSGGGQILNPNNNSWFWDDLGTPNFTVNPTGPGFGLNQTVVQAVNENLAVAPEQLCTEAARIDPQPARDCSDITIDYAHCVDNLDCQDYDGIPATIECPAATCDDVTNRCNPIVFGLTPNNGPLGTWTSVNGCYLGGYQSPTCFNPTQPEHGNPCNFDSQCGIGGECRGSRVIFHNQVPAKWPAVCGAPGSTWSDTSIIVEVPDKDTPPGDDAVTGPVEVFRSIDNFSAMSPADFTVNANPLAPGLCWAIPNQGPEQTLVTLIGDNFGFPRDIANDKVYFYSSTAPGNRVEVASYIDWQNQQIQVRVPAGAETNLDIAHIWYPNEVAVFKSLLQSNPVKFDVNANACGATCSNDAECVAVGPNLGCDATGCCGTAPDVDFVNTYPGINEVNVCRNTLVTVSFDMAMIPSTLNANNITLENLTAGGIVSPTSLNRGSQVIKLSYGLLDAGTDYRITVTTNVANSQGVHMLNNRSWTFQTRAQTPQESGICNIAFVNVTPGNHDYTALNENMTFNAQALDATGQPIIPIPGVLDWAWLWESTDTNIVNLLGPVDTDTVNTDALANGSVLIRANANATVGWVGTVIGQATANVRFCENPWSYTDVPGCAIGTCNENYNFTTGYCRGNAPPLLPVLDTSIPNRGWLTQNAVLRKQYLFRIPNTEDGIGIRVFANPGLLSVQEWYNQEVPNPGTIQALTVDGYDAIRDGTSVYVGATNYTAATGLNGRIFLFSYNSDAGPETVNIFNQLLDYISFNTNITTSTCLAVPAVPDKVCIARDLKRVNGVRTVAGLLNGYRAGGQGGGGSNLVKNKGFEVDDSTNYDTAAGYDNAVAGDDRPNGWSEPPATGTRDSVVKRGGAFSVKIETNGNQRYVYQDIQIEQGKKYIVSGWIRTDLEIVGGSKAALTTDCVDGGHSVNNAGCNLYHPAGVGLSGISEWTRQSFIVEANMPTSSRPYLRVNCYNGPNAASTGKIWCDDISVVEGTSIYPDLASGSFITGMTTSSWPTSWRGNFANQLGSNQLPVDPLNVFDNCPVGFDQTACWDDSIKQFICNQESHIYGYKTDQGSDYDLYANLEYEGLGAWTNFNTATDICADASVQTVAPGSRCGCFDYRLQSP